MKMTHRQVRRSIYVLLFLCMIALVSIRLQPEIPSSDTVPKELKETIEKTEKIIDFKRDGATVYALISKKGLSGYRDFVVIFTQKVNGKWERIYENDFTYRKPWKIETADIDGDGEKEILIAVNKTTDYDPIEKNRMFIYNFDGEKLYKKWTGSQIAGVWTDFCVGDLVSIPGEELIFIEQTIDEKEQISIYYWFDFGFFLLAASGSYPNIEDVSILGENRLQITYSEKEKKETITLRMINGKLVE